MKAEITIDTETGKYIEEYQTHAVKAVEEYIKAGKVIIRAKKHLEHGQIETFYKKCNLSISKAKQLCHIAQAESLNRHSGADMEINGYTVPIPEKIDIDFVDLRNIKPLENKINKGEATGIDLEDLLSGKRSYKEIIARHKQINTNVNKLNEAEQNTTDFTSEPIDPSKPYTNKEGDIVKPKIATKEEKKEIADIYESITKLKSREEKIANLLHGQPVKVGRKTYILTEVK